MHSQIEETIEKKQNIILVEILTCTCIRVPTAWISFRSQYCLAQNPTRKIFTVFYDNRRRLFSNWTETTSTILQMSDALPLTSKQHDQTPLSFTETCHSADYTLIQLNPATPNEIPWSCMVCLSQSQTCRKFTIVRSSSYTVITLS